MVLILTFVSGLNRGGIHICLGFKDHVVPILEKKYLFIFIMTV